MLILPHNGGVTLSKKTKKGDSKFNIKTIVASKGFYIALLTLIMVVGTVTVVRKFTSGINTSSSSFDDEAWNNAVAQASLDINSQEEASDPVENFPVEDIVDIPQDNFPEVIQNEAIPTTMELSDDEIIASLDMVAPCNGEINRKHSPDKLVYFKTTDDWRTHFGIDIASDEGTIVTAAADGVVEEVYEDKKMGITVVIGHNGNIKTLYANLQDLNFIEVGRKVAKGDTIGSVGASSLIEKKDDPHLHFEVLRNKTSENPTEYIPL